VFVGMDMRNKNKGDDNNKPQQPITSDMLEGTEILEYLEECLKSNSES